FCTGKYSLICKIKKWRFFGKNAFLGLGKKVKKVVDFKPRFFLHHISMKKFLIFVDFYDIIHALHVAFCRVLFCLIFN
ncbi:MAG: hypothetical protein ACLRFJ_00990, partial [Alphaproteobacteria bacterium]